MQSYKQEDVLIRNRIGGKAAGLAFFSYDVHAIVQQVDDYWFEMVGLERTFVNVHPYYMEHIHPEDLERVKLSFTISKGQRTYQADFRFYKQDEARYVWLRKTGALHASTFEGEPVLMMYGVYQNIDDEKRTQEEINQLANMLDIGMKNGHVDIWDYDLATGMLFLRCNDPKAYDLDQAVMTLPIQELMHQIHEEDRYYFEASVRNMWLSHEEGFRMNFRFVHPKTGQIRWLKVEGKVTEFDDYGRASRCVGIALDITKTYVDEEKLRKSKERLRQASHIAHLGSWEYNEATNQVEMLEGVHELLGLNPFENRCDMDKEGFIGLAIPEDREKVRAIFEVQHKWLQYDEYFFAKIKGNQKKLHIIATYKYDRSGHLKSIIGTIQDITEINNLEQALRQAEKMNAIGQLAGGIAHDFNNILMAISGYTELVMFSSESEDVLDYCNKVLDTIQRSTDLTRKLLAFSRKDSLIKKPMHLHLCIENAISILSRTIDRQIELKVHFQTQDDYIFADHTEIQNVFINLGLNARDAMPNGGDFVVQTEAITIGYDNHVINGFELRPGAFIKIVVSDTGCGIEKDQLKAIFDPFYTTKEIGKGTGLGLSATYGTVMSHEGAIDVESVVGIGTKFTIYLPHYVYGDDL